MVRRYLLLTLTLFISLSSPLMAAVDVSVDRTEIEIGETLHVGISVDKLNPDSEPDFAAFSKDFKILNTQQGSHIRSVNGNTTRKYTWTLTLSPRHTGRFTVPPLTIDGQATKPFTISVLEASPASKTTSKKPIAFEVTTDQREGYIQSQFLITLRVTYQVQLSQLDPFQLTIPDAITHPVGERKQYSKMAGNRRVGVVEQVFAVFPQRSGTLSIPSQKVNAATQYRSRYSVFPETKVLSESSQPLTLTVLPQPSSFPGNTWLPAQSINISDEWSNDMFMVDEAVTRTIKIDVAGMAGEQLPQLDLNYPANLKSYPEKPEIKTQATQKMIFGTASYKTAIIPTTAGIMTLPEVSIPWWNTQTNQLEYATLPSRTITVLPNPAHKSPALPTTPSLPSQNQEAPKVVEKVVTVTSSGIWPWLFIITLSLWVATLALWWYTNRRGSSTPTVSGSTQASKNPSYAELKQACLKNDPATARQLMLTAFKNHPKYSDVSTLDDIAKLGTETIRKEITQLNRHLYQSQDEMWNGKLLWNELSQLLKDDNTEADKRTPLASLNP